MGEEDVLNPALASISGNDRLCVPDANRYSKPLISDLPSEPEQVIYHCCCSSLLLHESLILAFAACCSHLKSCFTLRGPYKCQQFCFPSKEMPRAGNYRKKARSECSRSYRGGGIVMGEPKPSTFQLPLI